MCNIQAIFVTNAERHKQRARTKAMREFAILKFCIPSFWCCFPYRLSSGRMGCCHISEVNNAFAIGKFINDNDDEPPPPPLPPSSTLLLSHTQACVKAIVFPFFVDSLWIYYKHTSLVHTKQEQHRRAMAHAKHRDRWIYPLNYMRHTSDTLASGLE